MNTYETTPLITTKQVVTGFMFLSLVYLLIVSGNIQTGTLETFFSEFGMWMLPSVAAFGFLIAKLGLTIAGTYMRSLKENRIGNMMIGASVLISVGEIALVTLHGKEMTETPWKYYTFCGLIIGATILLELSVSQLYGKAEVEKKVESKVESLVETKQEKPERPIGKKLQKPESDIGTKIIEAARKMELETGKVNKSKLARDLETTPPTVRKYLKQLNGVEV